MAFFGEGDSGSSFQPFIDFREQFGFVPNVFRAQAIAPRLLEAEATVISPILFTDRALSRVQKECILLVSSAARRSDYCFALSFEGLRLLGVPEQRLERIAANYEEAKLTTQNAALVRLALKLATADLAITRADVGEAASHGLSDECLLEAILTAALGGLLCALAECIRAEPDFASRRIRSQPVLGAGEGATPIANRPGFYLPAPELTPGDFPGFASLEKQFGSVPQVFRAQTSRPDVIQAEAFAIGRLLDEGVLSRERKLTILLASEGSPFDLAELGQLGLNQEQMIEAAVTAGFACFFSILESGLGADPVFAVGRTTVPREMPAKKAHLSPDNSRPNEVIPPDPDAECVARIRQGDLDSFEELMNRHSRRVYRTLVGLLGDQDEARDALQDTFLKAFQHLDGFEGRSKFSTWLVSIAIRTGIQRLRDRRPMESLDENEPDKDGFRPRQVQAWTDDPERLYSRAEIRALIENSVMRLPAKYRLVLMLRDLEQLPIEEAASALGLGIPALKARLLRGRLMLRESLAPHFVSPDARASAKGVAL